MQKFIPLFPLRLIVFPGEDLNLHIFEPRYKQLVKECYESKKGFGIPPFMKDDIAEFGTEVEILSIEKEYPNGELDIKTSGIRVIRILEFLKDVPKKLYSAGIIAEIENIETPDPVLRPEVKELVIKFHDLLGIKNSKFENYDGLNSYDVGHYIGMDMDQQYHLLSIKSEELRQNFIYKHLRTLIPTLVETEKVKERIRANGHFKSEKPPEF
ncbi:MAG: LON peptidase substrate-binding domain-containing protein [Chitinophagales bacterium]|nr:LON peptidase substrate-binding domain-containing protein [Chitinophagales bacterium]